MQNNSEKKSIGEKFSILCGAILFTIFVIGLAWSISTGMAGFWRGLPFWIIVIFCLGLLFYDCYEEMTK